ncbi:uncharacterized protein LOC119103805 [Pollicipes pollicipes]|uniref:uncharacterized protein LOC119103805 n=1 Tax=Pollicipes pollicipes TaxID=41117 RepID=UPI001885913A|nr:uncharacterized protein LOC119103805 [Pollicipes pollicipes]
MWYLLMLLLCSPLLVAGDATAEQLQQTARALGGDSRLLYGLPTGSSLSLTTTLLTPIIEEGPITGVLNVTWVPLVLPLDQSAQQLQYLEGKRSRSDDLVDIYTHLQEAVEGFGFPGRPCVLRTICEAAGRRGDSQLMTRLLQLLLEVPPGSPDDVMGGELMEAKRLGTEDVSGCRRAFAECPGSLFDLLDSANLL